MTNEETVTVCIWFEPNDGPFQVRIDRKEQFRGTLRQCFGAMPMVLGSPSGRKVRFAMSGRDKVEADRPNLAALISADDYELWGYAETTLGMIDETDLD